jgi:VanZ family protein
MTKKRVVALSFLSVLLTATLIFIWGNSILTINKSSSVSNGLYKRIAPFFNLVFGEGVITHAVFRKLAHFCEFFILGVQINLLLITLKRGYLETLVFSLTFGLFFAVVDETLQVLSHRGSSIIDVLIDFGGILLSTTIIFIINKILCKKIKKGLD